MPIDPPEANPAKRKRLLTILALIFLIAATIWGVRWFLHSRGHESTDDAYVAGNLVRATPRVAGSVVAVLAVDSDFVKQGQVVVKLDDTDARLALTMSETKQKKNEHQNNQTNKAHVQQAA